MQVNTLCWVTGLKSSSFLSAVQLVLSGEMMNVTESCVISLRVPLSPIKLTRSPPSNASKQNKTSPKSTNLLPWRHLTYLPMPCSLLPKRIFTWTAEPNTRQIKCSWTNHGYLILLLHVFVSAQHTSYFSHSVSTHIEWFAVFANVAPGYTVVIPL